MLYISTYQLFFDFYKENLIEKIVENLYNDFRVKYPDVDYTQNIAHVLSQIAAILGTKFVIVIDEWDCVVRNLSNKPELVHQYLQFLHALFKSEESQSFLALVYITGILPIKKIKDESALNPRVYHDELSRADTVLRFHRGRGEGTLRRTQHEFRNYARLV